VTPVHGFERRLDAGGQPRQRLGADKSSHYDGRRSLGALISGPVVEHGVERYSEKVRRVDILEPGLNRRLEAGVPRSRTRAVGTLGAVTAGRRTGSVFL
jgi:hypothetical protein